MAARCLPLAMLLSLGCNPPPGPFVPPSLCALEGGAGSSTLVLADGWKIRSSADVTASDAEVASTAFVPDGWFDARVPSTVMGTLVDDGVYGDVEGGLRLRTLPGMDYPVGQDYSAYELSDSNPFKPPWWYRTELTLPPGAPGRFAWLRFEGANYRADVFLNGRKVAGETELAGTYRRFELPITNQLTSCGKNVLAVKLRAQARGDLGWNFVDWMPWPPDKLLGLWRPVAIVTTGAVRLRWPQVSTALALPAAQLTVRVEAENASDAPVDATVGGSLEGRAFSQSVTLAPHEKRELTFLPADHPALSLAQPRLWWPVHMGSPELYTMSIVADVGGRRSDETSVRFGVREVTSELTADGYRLFRVNGEKVLIRGAGWTPDMMLRLVNQRIDTDLRYALDMNLNAIRLEGKVGFEPLYDLADELGLFVLAGWCCCDRWEEWDQWTDEDHLVAVESMRDQARLLRNHPSALVWFNGSDSSPPPDVEKGYLDALAETHWPNPVVLSAGTSESSLSGPSGVKMRGPYKYEPPSYWSQDQSFGGAFGFNTETSVGEAIPPVDSLRKMLGGDHLWPLDEVWWFHTGTVGFGHMEPYLAPLSARYGEPATVEDLAQKAQLSAYENVRAMFEAYGRNKYRATGVIQWMLDNGWPSLIWHLYDFYLKPGGGYFGAKLANQPLHIQYGYDDRAVVVVGSTRDPHPRLTAEARVVDLAGIERLRQSAAVDAPPDASVVAFTLPELAGLTTTYFVDLRLSDEQGALLSRNFYWLSTVPDVLDYSRSELALTPTSSNADLTGLATLPMASLDAVATIAGSEVRVRLSNRGASLAFFARVTAVDPSGAELVPVHWSDNYVSLWPGETRELSATLPGGGAPSAVMVEGWNVASASYPLAPP